MCIFCECTTRCTLQIVHYNGFVNRSKVHSTGYALLHKLQSGVQFTKIDTQQNTLG